MTIWETPDKCWWCGSSDLSREHKYKKTDLDLLYGKSVYPQNDRMGLIKYKTKKNPIPVQSSSSDYLKFDPALCKSCNNAGSWEIDSAYTSVIEYYLKNDEQINKKRFIDFNSIFKDNWREGKTNFYRYCVKHVCSRLVESKISPSVNLINFLNGTENLTDIKFVFQIKNYAIGDNENRIDHLYLGPLNMFEQAHLFIGKKLTSVASWYTIKQFSINYLYRKYLLNDDSAIIKDSKLLIDIIDFSKLDGESFNFNQDSSSQGFGELIEYLQYFPFHSESKKMDHYNYILQNRNNI